MEKVSFKDKVSIRNKSMLNLSLKTSFRVVIFHTPDEYLKHAKSWEKRNRAPCTVFEALLV